jgi:membrane fusion protein (multidrug efflux system)
MKHCIQIICALIVITFYSCSTGEQQGAVVPDIPVVAVTQKDVPLKGEFVGQVYGLYDIPIRARVEGYLEGIHFEEGLNVKKGQKLYSIDPQPFEAAVAEKMSNLAVARTNLVHAENELKRIEPLARNNAVSKSELDAAIATRDASVASVEAAQANLRIAQIQLGYTKIESPINGIIGKTQARVGEFVGREPNPVILNTVSRVDTIRVQFFITESDYLTFAREVREQLDSLGRRKDDNRSKNNLELILADGSIHDHMGSIDFINREVDATTGAILLQASFPNPDKLIRPGQFAKVRATTRSYEDAILVPARSVMELQGQYSVYVVDKENMVEARQVKATSKVDEMWMIEEGLNPGDRVVISGLQKVRSGMKINPVTNDSLANTN